ncbi:MAG: hypothetical protein CMC19_02915 [Flavobacteriaceae bacterium]|nr:hypothetical protein [Flavobacteriaceae bacterium]OUX40088.1 MAG: hypothetical protein CBE25_01645 [Flavobacteriaceae bacterium TMED265]
MFPIVNDTVIFGIITFCLAFVFLTAQSQHHFWKKFYGIVPTLLLCYLLPALLVNLKIISIDDSKLYFVSSRYLLPAALILMTLSIDLKKIARLGPKALLMFFTGTFGIIIGGPIALMIVSVIVPSAVDGVGFDAIWRGLATIAGSWIGGGANQATMLEVFQYTPSKYGSMVLVDILMANIWLAILLFGVGKAERIDRWLKADTSQIQALIEKVSQFSEKVNRTPQTSDWVVLTGIAFLGVGTAHFFAPLIVDLMALMIKEDSSLGIFESLKSDFLWMVVIATVFGIALSFSRFKSYEGVGASKIGGVFIYILVATIGMQMDLSKILENPGLLLIGFVWICIHAALLILVAKLTKSPFFFLAVGSQANVGGAASAPVIAAEFHPSLSSVGILLAVFGYVVGTAGAYFCAILMEIASTI